MKKTERLQQRLDELWAMLEQALDSLSAICNEAKDAAFENEISEPKMVATISVGEFYLSEVPNRDEVNWCYSKPLAFQFPADEAEGWCECVERITGLTAGASLPFASTKTK